jgi:hypothetical protein
MRQYAARLPENEPFPLRVLCWPFGNKIVLPSVTILDNNYWAPPSNGHSR